MKVQKYIEFFMTKLTVLKSQKKYHNGKYELKYIFEDNNSDVLVVIFSACTRVGIKARYNYHRTLEKFKVNKLFILDDFGFDKRGAYYLGHNSDYEIQNCTKYLLNEITNKGNYKKVIYVGTSKGAYAALNFGIEKNVDMIIGAPQYYLGDYLNDEGEKLGTLKYIVGNINDENIKVLNNLLPNKVMNADNYKGKIYLHYSTEEHTYEEHIKWLIDDFDKKGIDYEEDVCTYTNHSDVSLHFPNYLVSTLKSII